jgi:hypothetical protein
MKVHQQTLLMNDEYSVHDLNYVSEYEGRALAQMDDGTIVFRTEMLHRSKHVWQVLDVNNPVWAEIVFYKANVCLDREALQRLEQIRNTLIQSTGEYVSNDLILTRIIWSWLRDSSKNVTVDDFRGWSWQ